VSSTLSPTSWIESLTPWPEEFGLERMRELLRDLGEPQRAYPSIHVVGTNGKGTATSTIEELLTREGLHVGAYYSPHVRSWSERIRVDGRDADFEGAIERVRPHADGATQFEVLTAAALAQFAEQGVDVAVIEAGLGGRHDATNVIDARVVLLTNVSLEHTEVLGDTREAIAREKLAVAGPEAIVVLGEAEWAPLVPERDVRTGGAREAAEAFLGRPLGGDVDWLLERLPRRDWTVVASILSDKPLDAMLRRLSRAGRTLIATRSSNPRSLAEKELASRAEPYFDRVESDPDPRGALGRAQAHPPVLVTGSLYLLADLSHED
jgi:dihydrofolate synthase/folylpolyglutamate synthase